MDAIRSVDDPYLAFVDSIKNSETRRKYTNLLYHFLKLVPNSVYEECLGKILDDNKIELLCKFFVELSDKNPKLSYNIIVAYVKEIKRKFEDESLSPNSFSNYIKDIRLIDANTIQIHWKSLQRPYPRNSVSQDRAYTKYEHAKICGFYAIDIIKEIDPSAKILVVTADVNELLTKNGSGLWI